MSGHDEGVNRAATRRRCSCQFFGAEAGASGFCALTLA